ncbi:MAG TPA: hypothetical protein VFQ35_20535 [Polyangiaceae bacterium]|nr:hypothetical protein [Polyangiaceae bacterium]
MQDITTEPPGPPGSGAMGGSNAQVAGAPSITAGTASFGKGGATFGSGSAAAGGALCPSAAFFPFLAGGAAGAAGAGAVNHPRNGFGCPATAPVVDTRCDWAQVQCVYDDFIDCEKTPNVIIFTCCNTKWDADLLCGPTR